MLPLMHPKQSVALALLKEGPISVHVNTRHPDISLPANLVKKGEVLLHWGWDLPVPIGDMKVTPTELSGILSFGGQRIFCSIPWDAVFALSERDSPRGRFFADCAPPHIVKAMLEANTKPLETPQVKEMRKQIDDAFGPPGPVAKVERSNVVSFADAKRRLRPNVPPKGSPFRPKGA